MGVLLEAFLIVNLTEEYLKNYTMIQEVWQHQPCRGYRDLCSKLHDKSESSFFGDASGKIPRPYGSSELDCELPNRGLLEGEETHTRVAVDQGNRSSQIAGCPLTPKTMTGQDFPDYEELDLMMEKVLL